MMSSIDQTIVATALGALKHDLHAPINWASWTVTVHALGRALGFPMLGRLSDQYGRRAIFGASVAVFTLAVRYIPAGNRSGSPQRVDITGMCCSAWPSSAL